MYPEGNITRSTTIICGCSIKTLFKLCAVSIKRTCRKFVQLVDFIYGSFPRLKKQQKKKLPEADSCGFLLGSIVNKNYSSLAKQTKRLLI